MDIPTISSISSDITPCGKFLGIDVPEGLERVTPELLNFCTVELMEELKPEVLEELGTDTGVTVAPGNLVTVVDFNCGIGFPVPGFLACGTPVGCVGFALKATVFWRPRFCILLLVAELCCCVVDCLLVIPLAGEDEDGWALLEAAAVFPPIRSRR